MQLLATRDTWWITTTEAALLAEGIPFEWIRDAAAHATLLDVPASEAERAAAVLAEQHGEELGARRRRHAPMSRVPLLMQPAFALGACMALTFLSFHGALERSADGEAWYDAGSFIAALAAHEPWRFLTAATLHADWPHALGNAAFVLVLAWAAGERLGVGAALALWALTAALGFAVSLAWGSSQVTLGASGGLFGLLGGAAGHALRRSPPRELLGHYRMRVLGAGASLLAMTAFSERANIAAHLGGFAAGLLLGIVLPRRAPHLAAQAISAALTLGAVVWCWRLAL